MTDSPSFCTNRQWLQVATTIADAKIQIMDMQELNNDLYTPEAEKILRDLDSAYMAVMKLSSIK